MKRTTAKVVVTGRTSFGQPGDSGVTIHFGPNYNDERNKEWAYYTPSLSISMSVRESVADNFLQGQKFTLTFEENADA